MKKIFLTIIVFLVGLPLASQESQFKQIAEILEKGNYIEVLGKLDKMPDSFEKYNYVAKVNALLDRNRLAIEAYQQALALRYEPKATMKLAALLKKTKQYDAALRLYESLHEKEVENMLVAYELGKLYLLKRKAKQALLVFQNLQKRDPTNANYPYYKGIVFGLLGKNNKRIDSFLEAFQRDSSHVKVLEKLAVSYTLLNDRDSAALFMEKGLRRAPHHFELNKLQANARYRSGEFEKVVGQLKSLDSVRPSEHYIKKMLGRSLFKLKRYPEAREYFMVARNLDRGDHKVYTYLGDIAFETKNYKRAALYYRMATWVGKDSRDAEYYRLARTLSEQKKDLMAIKMYKKAMDENRDNYRALYQLATKSESYYKDKKIAYEYYKMYIDRFESIDSLLTDHAKKRVLVIKKHYFQKGEILE